jgi:hypothetical protein
MSTKPVLILGILAAGAVGVFFSQKLWKKEITTIPTEKAPPQAKQVIPPMDKGAGQMPGGNGPPANLPPEIEKLNAMQEEIAKLSDEEIEKEMASLKKQAQDSGLLADNVDVNQRPELKAMLTRMALLRVEKAKRGKKAEADGP